MAEEEDMELSGESNLVSNLHNFSFDVSWASRELSPPIQRKGAHILSPARFTHNAPDKFIQTVPASSPARSWKSLALKPINQSTPTVKLSHKTAATYHTETPPTSNNSNQRHGYSPMELDQSENSFETKMEPQIKKRHSDFGISYTQDKMTNCEPKKSLLVIPEKGPTFRHRNINNNVSNISSGMEDTVFDSTHGSEHICEPVRQNMRTNGGAASRKTSSALLVLSVLVVSLGIAAYMYVQLEKCAVFDVDVVKLGHKLEDSVFGQHIAVKTVVEALEKFGNGVQDGSGKRHLVLSFHGWTGIGKNYVSKFIAEAFYNAKVTLFLIPLHFIDRTETNDGRNWIQSWIVGNVSECGVNILIFDEMDKAEPDHLVAVQAAMETIIEKSRMDNSKTKHGPITVFIFLGNSRSRQINQYLFSQLLNDRERDLIRKSEFDEIFTANANEWYENLKTAGLIHYFIPFLPLAESHVKQCIEREFVRKGRDPSTSLISAVMEELSFFDMGGRNGQMSLTGCKRVEDKVNLHMDD